MDGHLPRAFQGQVFLKSGTYSDKFDFTHPLVDLKTGNLGDSLYHIFYNAEIVGAGMTNHLVLREYIPPTKGTPTIYKGMPLRTEIRFFVDFDEGTILGYADYWDPAEMVNLAHSRISYRGMESLKLIHADVVSRLDQLVTKEGDQPSLKTWMRSEMQDFMTWYDWWTKRATSGQTPLFLAQLLAPNIKTFVTSDKVKLTGKWSIDLMLEGDQVYFIDAALMHRSALTEHSHPLPIDS